MKPLLALALLAASAVSPAAERDRADRASAQFPRVKGEKGLFVGSLRVCRDTVAQARRAADSVGNPTLDLVFTPAAAARLRSESAALVGRQMTIRIDGRTVMAPYVREEITGGTLQISGPPERDFRDIRRAALDRC